jgi:RNA polymerase sigma factor (sigma-70 family)
MKHQLDRNELDTLQQYLWRQALYYTNDNRNAKELVQDTFYKVISKVHLYSPHTNFKTWASTILKNLYVSKYKKQKKYTIADLESTYRALVQDQTFNSEEYQLLKSEIYKILEELSNKQANRITFPQETFINKESLTQSEFNNNYGNTLNFLTRTKRRKTIKSQAIQAI